MPAPHGRRRARIAFSDAAAKQLENITSEAEIHALDRALVVVSVDPDIGDPLPGDSTGPQLRQYTDDIERVRLLYWVTALRTGIISGLFGVVAAQGVAAV
ncbi:hypothetical protein [Streptomyces sp. NPDC002640]